MNKRTFLKNMGALGLTIPFQANALEWIGNYGESFSPQELAGEEGFWRKIRDQYIVTSDYINLENGYYAMMPKPTLESYINHIRGLNQRGSHYMRKDMANEKLVHRKLLANFLNVPVEELIITRNTTESMDTIICGLDWKAGDEAILSYHDYGSMIDMFKQQEKRFGMVNKFVSVPNLPQSDEEIVGIYRDAITPKTKLILVCHMINITGQILPIRKICDMAHAQGVEVLVDGAHAIAHLDFNIKDLNCDYYGSSLHKWLSVPLGAGLLYVKQEKIKNIWPLFGESAYPVDDIRKLNHTGTQPMSTEKSIANAVQFHDSIGSKRKEERLRYLQLYWTEKVRSINGIVLNTPAEPNRSCAIANVWVNKFSPADMAKHLMEKYQIWTVAIDNPKANVRGCRITPSVFTSTIELDALVKALLEMNQS